MNEKKRRLFSASEEEIVAGKTSDVYFVRTQEILKGMEKEKTNVTMEIFSDGAVQKGLRNS